MKPTAKPRLAPTVRAALREAIRSEERTYGYLARRMGMPKKTLIAILYGARGTTDEQFANRLFQILNIPS